MAKVLRYIFLGGIASLLAIYVITSQINMELFRQAWAGAHYLYVLPCALLLFLGLFTRAIRWRLLLSEGLPLSRAFGILNVSYLINGFIPFRIGELARAYLATRATPPVPILKSISTIIVERLLDLLAVVLLIVVVLAAGPVPTEIRAAGIVAGVIAIGGFSVLIFLARRRDLAHRLMAFVTTRFPARQRFNITAWLDHFLDGLQPISQVNTLLQAVGWTAVSWGLSVAAGYILMLTFYENASWIVACLFIAAASFAIAVPAVPGNVGTYELSILLALGSLNYGEPASIATAFAVMVHTINLGVYCIAGVIGFIQEGVSFEQLSQGVRGVTHSNDIKVTSNEF